jgi:RecG-like helicase
MPKGLSGKVFLSARCDTYGTTALYDGMLQMVHPDRVVSEADLDKLPLVEPVYPLTEGLSLNQVRKVVDSALLKVPTLPQWQDEVCGYVRTSGVRRRPENASPASRTQ